MTLSKPLLPTFGVSPTLRVPNPRVIWSLLFPAARRLFLKLDKGAAAAALHSPHETHFNWTYQRDRPEIAHLYEAAKRDQWNSSTALSWDTDVDPLNPEVPLIDDAHVPMQAIATYASLPAQRQREQRHGFMVWMLSQFLHGEQGALFAACEITESMQSYDAKLYGASQVGDEGRHVEVFHQYLSQKMNKMYAINDNLFTILDALVSDRRWDIKFLGMQIMVEGLALGAFGIMRRHTREPLLRQLLRYVITDEARHVHYGVTVLGEAYKHLSDAERREREDWAFEVAVLMRNRFLAHEFYEEYYAHSMTRKQWETLLLNSSYMQMFRDEMFRRLIPNLKRIHLLSKRLRPHYEALGLLKFEQERAAPELPVADLLA